jgi:hypothetical protein
MAAVSARETSTHRSSLGMLEGGLERFYFRIGESDVL